MRCLTGAPDVETLPSIVVRGAGRGRTNRHAAGFVLWTVLVAANCAPASLYDAIRRQPDLKAKDQLVIIPVSASSVLGYEPIALPKMGDSDRVSVKPKACLIVPSTAIASDGSVTSLKVEYTSGATLGAELKNTIANVGFNIANKERATFELKDVRVQRALGIPDPSGPCGNFDTSKKLVVIGAQVVAGSASLRFDSTLESSTNGSLTNGSLKNSGFDADGTAKATQGKEINGSNLVVAAQQTAVELEIQTVETDLGTAPAVNSYDFPLFPNSGSVVVEGFSQSANALTVHAAPTVPVLAVPARELVTCDAHQRLSLTGDQAVSQCNVVFKEGTSMVAISWRYSDHSPKHVLLRLRAFRTKYGN